MRKLLFSAFLLYSANTFASDPVDSAEMVRAQLQMIDSIENNLHYKTGKVVLKDGLATVNIAPGFKFLEGPEAQKIIEDVWGNLKGKAPLGMIVPANSSAIYADYAFIVQFEEIGYVKDGDAGEINYDDLMKEMKEDQIASNEERRKAGLQTLTVLGWAAKPFYDKERKILHWAKELQVEGSEGNTLNYDVRVLGRKGVLVLQAVAGMDQLDSVNANINNILNMVAFNEGNRYTDFDSKTDDVAAWTIGGLVAGKMLAKVGFFGLILKYLKLIILGLTAAGGAIWRFVSGRKKKEEEVVSEPAPQPVAEEQV